MLVRRWARVVGNKEKVRHNLQVLTLKRKKHNFIYVPSQYGQLSQTMLRAITVDEIEVPDGENTRTYKLLSIPEKYDRFHKGKDKKIIWWHKRIHKSKRSSYFEYSFEKFSIAKWDELKRKATIVEKEESFEEPLKEKESDEIIQSEDMIL